MLYYFYFQPAKWTKRIRHNFLLKEIFSSWEYVIAALHKNICTIHGTLIFQIAFHTEEIAGEFEQFLFPCMSLFFQMITAPDSKLPIFITNPHPLIMLLVGTNTHATNACCLILIKVFFYQWDFPPMYFFIYELLHSRITIKVSY